MGVGISFSHVPIQNKVFLEVRCLTLGNGEASRYTYWGGREGKDRNNGGNRLKCQLSP